QQIEPERDDRENFSQRQNVEAVAVETKRRQAGQGEAKRGEDLTEANERRASPIRTRDVGRGGHALRTLTRPKIPSGRTISTAMMTMKVIASPNDGET